MTRRGRSKAQRYIVTGPGLEVEPSYQDEGPAHSRALTAACGAASKGVDATYYVEDAVLGQKLGYSESFGESKTVATVTYKGAK